MQHLFLENSLSTITMIVKIQCKLLLLISHGCYHFFIKIRVTFHLQFVEDLVYIMIREKQVLKATITVVSTLFAVVNFINH